eukprot:COSAG03_NODE_3075_length_2247_cov_1.700652_1_plen_87_part_00
MSSVRSSVLYSALLSLLTLLLLPLAWLVLCLSLCRSLCRPLSLSLPLPPFSLSFCFSLSVSALRREEEGREPELPECLKDGASGFE